MCYGTGTLNSLSLFDMLLMFTHNFLDTIPILRIRKRLRFRKFVPGTVVSQLCYQLRQIFGANFPLHLESRALRPNLQIALSLSQRSNSTRCKFAIPIWSDAIRSSNGIEFFTRIFPFTRTRLRRDRHDFVRSTGQIDRDWIMQRILDSISFSDYRAHETSQKPFHRGPSLPSVPPA